MELDAIPVLYGTTVGTTREDGTDKEQRDDARKQYEGVIRDIAHSGALEGQDIGKTWDKICDHWSESEANAGTPKHPEPGYSASARLIDGDIHTSNAYEAQRALLENKKSKRAVQQRSRQGVYTLKAKGKEAARKAGRRTPLTFHALTRSRRRKSLKFGALVHADEPLARVGAIPCV
jgi:hypothetical protein